MAKKCLRSCLFLYFIFFLHHLWFFGIWFASSCVLLCRSQRTGLTEKALTGCWINGWGINKDWGTICVFFFFLYDTHFTWCPVWTASSNVVCLNFWDTFASAASDAVLWQSVTFIQVCVWITHIFYFFTSCIIFIYQLWRSAALRVYKQPLSHPPWYLCFVKMQNQKNKH